MLEGWIHPIGDQCVCVCFNFLESEEITHMERADPEDVEAVESITAAELALGPLGLGKIPHSLRLELARHSDDVPMFDHSLAHLQKTPTNQRK